MMRPLDEEFPVPAHEVIRRLAIHPLTEVTVDVGGILIDVYDVGYDAHRDKVVLKVLPEDLADAVRRMSDRSGRAS